MDTLDFGEHFREQCDYLWRTLMIEHFTAETLRSAKKGFNQGAQGRAEKTGDLPPYSLCTPWLGVLARISKAFDHFADFFDGLGMG
jgi:hypothetical protein